MYESETNYYRDDHLKNIMNDTQKEFYSKNPTNKKENFIGGFSNRDFRKFYDFIEDSLYIDFFNELISDISAMQNETAKKRFVRTLFSNIFSDENFNFMLKHNHLLPFSCILTTIVEDELKEYSEIIKSSISIDEASKTFSMLVVSNNLKAANYFLEIAELDISFYPVTLDSLFREKDEESLLFMLSSMKNLHFNKDQFIRMSYNLSIDFIKVLVEKYGFDLNAQDNEKMDLLTLTVVYDNLKLFTALIDTYPDKILFTNDALFRSVESNGKEMFLQNLLLCNSIKSSHLEQIGLYLFSDGVPEKLYKTNLYSLFFKHPNFDDHMFTLGQGYFIYGILSKLGITAKKIDNNAAKPLVHILDEYLQNYKGDNVPESPQYHIVGAALQVANICNKQATNDSCTLILRRFPKYINLPNPNGSYPIQQVSENQSLERILMNLGAKRLKKDSIIGSFFGLFKQKEDVIEDSNQPNSITEYISSSPSASNIRDKIRIDFERIKQIISSPSFDFEIKILCENMFLKADRLAIIIEKNSLVSFTSEIHFLSENFSNYLLKSVETFHKISTSGIQLQTKDSTLSSVDVVDARKVCLKHIDLLTEQLNLLIDNVSTCVEEEGLLQMKVRTKFLEEKFANNKNQPFLSDTVNVLTTK